MLYKKPTLAQKFVTALFAVIIAFLLIKGVALWEWERPPSGGTWESSTALGRILSFNSAQERLFKISAVVSLFSLIGFGIAYACLTIIGSIFQPYRITAQSIFMAIIGGVSFWFV